MKKTENSPRILQRRDGLAVRLVTFITISKRAMSRVQWQAESYFAPTRGMILESNGAAVSLDQQFAGIEAKTAGLARFLAWSRLTMIELLEDVRQVGKTLPRLPSNR